MLDYLRSFRFLLHCKLISLAVLVVGACKSSGYDWSGPSCEPPVGVYQNNANVPEWAIRATVRVTDWHGSMAAGGTGTIIDYDPETKTSLVITCRHVVELEHGRIECTMFDGLKVPARFVGVHEMAYPKGADITILEIDTEQNGKNIIDTYVPISRTPLKKGEQLFQVGWGGGHLNKRIGHYLGLGGFSGGGWRYHWNCEIDFQAISGDSGSGIFSAERKELVGVLWGGGGTTLFCGPEYVAQAYELCCRRGRRGGRSPGGSGGGSVPSNPGGPGKPEFPSNPKEPAKPEPAKPEPAKPEPAKPVAPSCPCPTPAPAPVNLAPITDSLTKLTEIAKLTNESVGKLGERVDGIDKRLGVVEGKLAANAPGSLPPTPSTTPQDQARMDKLQADLDKLRNSLKQSGTLRISVLPK